jgi:hypothetical protein
VLIHNKRTEWRNRKVYRNNKKQQQQQQQQSKSLTRVAILANAGKKYQMLWKLLYTFIMHKPSEHVYHVYVSSSRQTAMLVRKFHPEMEIRAIPNCMYLN